jgi:hypothetical protein
MEPQFMIAGQAAGIAAAMASKADGLVHAVPLAELQSRLSAAGQILKLP